MKARTVKTILKQLVRMCGGRKPVAEALNVTLGYVYQLEKGRVPGGRLYRDIITLYGEMIKK